jgi:hypothetical protein
MVVAVVLGYSSPSSYAQPVLPDGGGGGRWFTGSPADGFDCSVCHAGGPALELEITGLPVEGWTPGERYELWIGWADPAAHVSLLAELARASGGGIGQVELAAADSLMPDERCAGGPRAAKLHPLDQDRTIASLADCGASLLRMTWTAPAQADEDAWLFLAGVHADASEDPTGDGVMIERIRLPGPASEIQEGCAITERPRATVGLGLVRLLALACFTLVLVRPRRGRAAQLVVLLSMVSACARVQPHQRGRLAGTDMQMEIDPELCAGRTHAVEYREGSAGGLGGGGGGCGCN